MDTENPHLGHKIVKDKFMLLAGVKRLVSGKHYCLTCRQPVDLGEDENEKSKTK